ncbi:MAG: universal stress protein [Burkholderiales bacterium]
MFKHLLIPTDGSPLAAKGVKIGVRLAKALGAKVTGVYVMAPYVPPILPEGAVVYVPSADPREYKKAMDAHAAKALGAIEREAKAAELRCESRALNDPQPWQGILKAARAGKCDAIVIASHGRGGLGGLLLGSQTARVLSHSKIPVLVVR